MLNNATNIILYFNIVFILFILIKFKIIFFNLKINKSNFMPSKPEISTKKFFLSISFKLITFSILLYATYFPKETKAVMKYDEKLKFNFLRSLTNWSLVLTLLNLIYYTIDTFIFIFSLNIIVTSTFWPLYFYNKRLIIPKLDLCEKNQEDLKLEFCKHLLPLFTTFVNFFLMKKKQKICFRRVLIFVTITTVMYAIIAEVAYFKNGVHSYGFIEKYGPFGRFNVYLAYYIVSSCICYLSKVVIESLG